MAEDIGERKWTRGPWYAIGPNVYGVSHNRLDDVDEPLNIAVADCDMDMRIDADTEAAANAALIASAPDLYEALKLIEFGDYDEISDLHSCGLCGGSERGGHTANCKIRAALLKAHPSNARGGEA